MEANYRRGLGGRVGLLIAALCVASGAAADSRIRTATYSAEEVYRLAGRIGFQIDIQFEPGESFVGLAAGDLQGLSFIAQGNHLFLKPKAARLDTNLTVLTTLRDYQFDYTVAGRPGETGDTDLLYVLKFAYPPNLPATGVDELLHERTGRSAQNLDYWYCGHPALKPEAASDDGVHTRLRFAGRAELPAVFVSNDDGSESLLNFSMEGGDVVIHRVARKFIVRRGKLTGCIVNRGYAGSGDRVSSGTVSPSVQRETRAGRP